MSQNQEVALLKKHFFQDCYKSLHYQCISKKEVIPEEGTNDPRHKIFFQRKQRLYPNKNTKEILIKFHLKILQKLLLNI